ncbi:hypothetical protein [Faecalimonas sp.]
MNKRRLGVLILILVILYGLSGVVAAEDEEKNVRIEYEEPNGKNQYYIKKPTVNIYHAGKELFTRIRLQNDKEMLLEKSLDEKENSFRIDENTFKEGQHKLIVWQENQEGEEIKGTRSEKEFNIDTVPPEEVDFQYEGVGKGEILYFQKETIVKLRTMDQGSGIENIFYQIEGAQERKESVGELQLKLPEEFQGKITAWAEDFAGNKNKVIVSKYIVCDMKKPDIVIHTDLETGKWYSKNINTTIEVKDSGKSSGIESIRCYFNGKMIKEIEKLPEFCREEKFDVQLKELGELMIEARDYSGNIAWEKQKILIDKEKPEIVMSGSYPNMITSKVVRVEISAQDTKRLKTTSVTLKKKNEINENIILEQAENQFVENQWKTDLEIVEDGIYIIEVKAVDMAGNVERKEQQIIIDKTNPIIRHVDELNGKWLKRFEWTYPISEFIFDLTKFRYEIRLDGKLQPLYLLEAKEGKHIFYVKATDCVGNEAMARAEFMIDHTKPEIFIEGIEDFEMYESVEMKIGVKDETEKLQGVWINGEKQRIDVDSKVFHFISKEIGEYTIDVQAIDLAGNRAQKRIHFSIEEKKNILEKIFTKVEKEERKDKEKNEKENKVMYIVSGLLIFMAMGVILCYKKKKRPCKREDAE